MFTELLLWAEQLKSHLSSNLMSSIRLNNLQVDSLYLASVILLAYLLLMLSNPTDDKSDDPKKKPKPILAKVKIFGAFIAAEFVAYSPIYDMLSNVQLYSAYSLIYIATARFVTNKKIKYTLVIMSVFEFLMAYDRYVNAGTATWLYDSFEEITFIIHGLIISSSLKLKPINLGAILGRFITAMRGLSHSYCLTSRL